MNGNDETRQREAGGSRGYLAGGEAALIVAQSRRGRHAHEQRAPLACGTYGLTPSELRAEAQRLVLEKGWQLWEVAARLALPARARKGARA